jgi:MFS family permease
MLRTKNGLSKANQKNLSLCLTGLCLFIIALGINRYAYTPIIPFLIFDKWATLPQAGYIGAANFLGYFIGSFLIKELVRYFYLPTIIRATLFFSVISVVLCSFNLGPLWLSVWRFVAGLMAGIVMVSAPTIILSRITKEKKAWVSGVIFSGIGLGIVLTSLLTGFLNQLDRMIAVWLGFTALAFFLSMIANTQIKKIFIVQPKRAKRAKKLKLTKANARVLIFAMSGYALYALGLTPSLLFLPDYAHRVLHASLNLSGYLFSLLGVGCIVGALLSGWLHKKLGCYRAIIFAFSSGVIALLLVSFSDSLVAIGVSSFLTGFQLIALVVLISLLIGDLVGMRAHITWWSYFTLVFSGFQFLAGYVFSYLLSLGILYVAIFWIGLGCLLLSFASYLFLPKKLNR